MVETFAALLRTPPANDTPTSASSPASSSASSYSTAASPTDFFSPLAPPAASTTTHNFVMNDNDSNSDSAELFGLLDDTNYNNNNNTYDLDVTSSFRTTTARDGALLVPVDSDDVAMRDAELLPATNTAPQTSSTRRKPPRSTTIKREGAVCQSTDSTHDARSPSTTTQLPRPLSTLELRRKRNRESMRRARDRQRSATDKLESVIETLEQRLETLLQVKEASLDASTTVSYSALLRETEQLRVANDVLRDDVDHHAHFQQRIARLAAAEQLALQAERDAQDAQADAAMLQPLLEWLTPLDVTQLVCQARDRVLVIANLTDALVDDTAQQSLLGWRSKRALQANYAHYTMHKSFTAESALALANKTWDCTINNDVGNVRQVLSWTAGTKVLTRLSPDAAIVAREMAIPNLQDSAHPTRIRYILLVFRTVVDAKNELKMSKNVDISADNTRSNGINPIDASNHPKIVIGTVTLNVFGTTIDECLEQRVSHQHNMTALTMYAFVFTPRRRAGGDTNNDADEDGCDVTLAGRSGDGTATYARKVLFEVLPSILRWENTFVAPILRVAG